MGFESQKNIEVKQKYYLWLLTIDALWSKTIETNMIYNMIHSLYKHHIFGSMKLKLPVIIIYI